MAASNPSRADYSPASLADWYHSAAPYILSLAATCSRHQQHHHHNSSASSSSDEAEDQDRRFPHHHHHDHQRLHHHDYRLHDSALQTAVQPERFAAADENQVNVKHASNTDNMALADCPTYLVAAWLHEKQAASEVQPPLRPAMPVAAASAPLAKNPAMDHHQPVTRPGPAASNPTRKPKAGFGMSGTSHSGNLSHSGPIMLNTGPIISHSGPLKGASAGKCHPSIIPAEIMGKKKPAGFEVEEPLSPEVTCLGRVKIKKKFCRTQKDEPVARSDHTDTSLKEGMRKQKAPEARSKKKKAKKREAAPANPSLQGARRLSKNHSTCGVSREAAGYTTGQFEQGYEEDLTIDLSRFGNDTECAESGKQRGAILAKSLVNLLQQACMLEAETPHNDQYVPQVPPSNSLLLMRGSRNLEHFHNQLHAGSEYDNLNESVSLFDLKKAAMAQRQVSLPDPPPEAQLWQRRAIAKPSALNIKRPPGKLEIKKPTTR